MAQNVGTLVSSAIRPNNSLDPIASAFASEIRGGLHTATSSTDRNNIIFERREWGMMCYVVNDNQTYQLNYGLQDTNIMNNNNWSVFSGSGGGGGSEWLDSVIAIQSVEPISPNDGDRYIIGQSPTGTNWISLPSNLVVQWNSTLSQWDQTFPTDETSVRVDNEDNAIYNYEGNWPTGQWYKERLGQVRDVLAITSNGEDYITTSEPPFNGYTSDLIFLTKFSSNNISGTVSLDVNGLGSIQLKKPSPSGLSNLNPNDLVTGVVYSITFDGTYFQINRPYTNDDIFSIKYYIEPTDYIVVPQYYQYWVYSDLEIAGNLVNYGHVIIANGSLILSGGTFSNYGNLAFVTFNAGLTTSYNNSDTIQFTQSNTIFGLSVSAIVADNSLTASKLDTGTNGGPTAGYLLSVDNSGDFVWSEPPQGGVITYDDKNFIMTFDTVGDGQFTGLTISQTPVSGCYVGVFINGQEFEVGTATNSSPAYFSDNGGLTAKLNIVSGDGLYWNGNIVGTDLLTGWRISLFYLT
jgi:hypothetical protein